MPSQNTRARDDGDVCSGAVLADPANHAGGCGAAANAGRPDGNGGLAYLPLTLCCSVWSPSANQLRGHCAGGSGASRTVFGRAPRPTLITTSPAGTPGPMWRTATLAAAPAPHARATQRGTWAGTCTPAQAL